MRDTFVPVGGELDFSKASLPVPVALAQRVKRGETVPAKTLDDLPDAEIYSRSFDYAFAAELQLVAASANAERNKKVFVHEFLRFLDYYEGNEGVRIGVGLRFVIEASITNANLAISGLAALAAAAELRMAETSVSYRIIGISGVGVDALHPKTMEFLSVDNYKLMGEAIDRVREFVASGRATLTPKLMQVHQPEIPGDGPSEYDAAVFRVMALSAIADGKTLAATLGDLDATDPGRVGEGFVRGVFANVCKTTRDDEAVPAVARTRATTMLQRITAKPTSGSWLPWKK